MTQTPPYWTDERIDELKRHWIVGLSCGAIAKRMDTGRNAIIGKAHRLGLVSRKPQLDPEEQARKKQEREDRAAARKANVTLRILNRRKKKVQEPKFPEKQTPFISSLNIPFGDLRPWLSGGSNQCRYIAAEIPGPDYLACGNETLPGESWCGHCSDIVFNRGQVPVAKLQEAA